MRVNVYTLEKFPCGAKLRAESLGIYRENKGRTMDGRQQCVITRVARTLLSIWALERKSADRMMHRVREKPSLSFFTFIRIQSALDVLQPGYVFPLSTHRYTCSPSVSRIFTVFIFFYFFFRMPWWPTIRAVFSLPSTILRWRRFSNFQTGDPLSFEPCMSACVYTLTMSISQ